jgi:hypothetical protein
MSDGGLLQKAIEQQSESDTVIDGVVSTSNSSSIVSSGSKPISFVGMIKILFIGAILPFFLLMWFGIYIDLIPITILTPLVISATLVFVWWKLDVGLPTKLGGNGFDLKKLFAVVMTYMILVGTPFVFATIFVGDISLGEVEFNDDGSQLTVKIRQNGGGGTHDAMVSVFHTNQEVWSSTESFTFNKEDYQGDYGQFTINTLDFWDGNSLPSLSNNYSIQVKIGDYTSDAELDPMVMTRVVTAALSSSIGSISNNADDCEGEDKETCIVAVGLTTWAGITSLEDYPGPLSYADYTIKATLYYENHVAIDYPIITVVKTEATWESMSGKFGTGSGTVGIDGSQLALTGSADDNSLGMSVIPKSDWEESDFGCYTFTVEVMSSDEWSDEADSVISSSYYLYEETGSHSGSGPPNPSDPHGATDEAWTELVDGETC